MYFAKMEDERDILLRIDRQYNRDETILFLRHYIGVLKQEIGMLKGELAEARELAEKLRVGKKLKRKQWLEEEIFVDMAARVRKARAEAEKHRKNAEDWQMLYFRLLNASTPNDPV